MKFVRTLLLLLLCGLACLPALALDDVVITEFMAENDNTLDDEDGDSSDWIEVFNAGTNTVNLNGWSLTDSQSSPGWRFPATNLPVNSFIVVFASGKDRRIPGRPLHTDFKLNDSGDYLALLKPDGTVQSAYSPAYPLQVPGISYGIPVTLSSTTLLTTGAAGKFTVPLNAGLGLDWTYPGFNDGSWASVNNGVGFEGDSSVISSPTLIADSHAEFSGNQGGNGWFYGYWDRKADINGDYEPGDFIAFPRGTGNVLAGTNFWNGTKWDFPAGDPSLVELTAGGGQPSAENGNTSLPVQWAIRRYVSETNGPLRITGILACQSQNGLCGDGVIGRIFVDGVQVFTRTVSFSSEGYSIVVSANLGSTIDLVIDAGNANNDFCDGTTFTAKILTTGGATVVADTIADWSISGTQGENNWSYGYFNATTGGTYTATKFIPFPSGTGPHSTANFWNGEAWKWFDGDPPFDTIGQTEMRPSAFQTGGPVGNTHWAIRRWVSEVGGTIHVDWHIGKKDLTGNGMVGAIYQNGTQRDTFSISAADFTGTNRTITISGVQVGDVIDLAVTPGTITPPEYISGDLCFLNATIHGNGTLAGQFASDVGNLMTNINSSAYLRLPFNVADARAINGLTLRLKYDDGFAAYLNGNPVASANAPGTLEWNSAAASPRPDADAAQFQDFTLDNWSDFLVSGDNVLAIHGLNASAADADFLLAAQLVAVNATLDSGNQRYFSGPTPGSLNGAGTTTIGPLITRVRHNPAEPADAEDLVVSARVSPTLNGVASVSLYYRVMFGAETSLPMLDDGLHGDGVAGDGIYGASIPNTAYTSGQMVRYYFIARDSANNLSRQPPMGDTNNSSLYFGTVVQDPSLTNQLPVLHWFTPVTVASTTFQRVAMYWQGEFYDNIKMNTHGQSSGGFRNHSYNVDFNPDHNFKPSEDLPRVDDINLLSSYADKAHMRLMLSYQIYNDSGPRAPYHYVVPARMQSNGVFHSIMHITENGDDKYLERIGRDRNGAMYKMYTDPSLPANAEKKTRRWEDKSDFTTLVAGINSATNRLYIFDNVDVSEAINFFAAMIITASVDCCHKNFYLYRDSDGDGEWEMLPWDFDLSFGRNWQSGETYWDDRVYPQNGLNVGATFPLGPYLFSANQTTRAMYLRRVRTLQDELLQTNGTPAAEMNFEKQIDYWTALMKNDGALDIAKWGTWGMGQGGAGGSSGAGIYTTNMICVRTGEPSVPCWRTLEEAAAELKTNYMVRRRTYVFNQKMGGALPDPQPVNAVLRFGTLEYNPSSGNQNEEFLTLVNTNNYAVDISGWKLAGAIEHTFQGGVVIPNGVAPTNTLYVVPDKKAFRRRATGPKGNQGLYVEGPYKGQLSARGETIVLIDKAGRTNQSFQYTGNPSGPQKYLRITEIMYHPPGAPVGSPYEAEDFEYIEIKNIGPTNQNLAGVRFMNGIEFDFTGSAVTTLAPGAHVLVVKNLAAFTSRYGAGLNVAGQYVGFLDNGGERLQLLDAVNEEIHDFSYNNSWYPITDGPGASLVVVDEAADTGVWGNKEGWRPSATDFGSPAQNDPAPASAPAPIVINELLTHTDLPQVDAIELLNPTVAEVNISGWFISDDFANPKKFRVPDNTVIPAGGHLVFYESNSFGVGPNGFAISSKGDETYLFSGNGTNLTGHLHGYSFGAAENGISFGRYTNSQTNVHFVAMSALTLGSANAAPKVGPVVISEINYRPDEQVIGVDNTIDEFLELANTSGASVSLFDPANPANTWRLRGAVDFDFPTGVTLPAGGHVIIVSFNPAETALFNTFTSRFSVPGNVRVVGPWDGQLGNLGESVRLLRPDAPDVTEVPYILVDQVDYSNRPPWSGGADGIGLSLQRLVESNYGNDPLNWIGVAPSAAAPYVPGGTAPSITGQPQNVTAVAGRSATFSVSVAGTPPFSYRWRYNGTNPVGSSPTLTLNNVQANQAGPYSVVVFNSAGSADSASARLSVVFPPSIIQQPLSRSVYIKPDPRAANLADGTNVTFVVGASSGNPGLGYQWFFNGTSIPGATASSLLITNVSLEDEGDYSVAVSDSVDTVMSATARLVPWLQPVIVKPPVGQVIAAGSDFTMSVEVTGNPVPIAYSWRRGSIVIATNSGNYRSNFVTLNSAAAGLILTNNILSSNYTMRLVVYNDANNSPGILIAFTNTIVADLDRDGIPDYIEQDLGLSTNNAVDAGLDLDGDGASNRAEYLAGTDPASNLSYLRIDQGPGAATVSVAAVSNRTYTIQFTDNLNSGAWSRLADIVARPNNRVESFIDPNWTTNRFYRAVVPRQP
jgi:hypothetical protein